MLLDGKINPLEDKNFLNKCRNFVKEILKEDIGSGDLTTLSTIPKKAIGQARLLVKDSGIIAGIDLAKIFSIERRGLNIKILKHDGERVKQGDVVFTIEGNIHEILSVERSMLNCMQRMSAIATKTSEYCSLVNETKAKILDTRKTTPLNRIIDKWAVKIGGGNNHRFGLYDMIMIKDNHIDFSQNIISAIKKAKSYLIAKNTNVDIVVEARNLNEVEQILIEGGVKRILLDNFNYKETRKAVKMINGKHEIESSGGITKKSVRNYALCGVDYISIGELTHAVSSFDLSLDAF